MMCAEHFVERRHLANDFTIFVLVIRHLVIVSETAVHWNRIKPNNPTGLLGTLKGVRRNAGVSTKRFDERRFDDKLMNYGCSRRSIRNSLFVPSRDVAKAANFCWF